MPYKKLIEELEKQLRELRTKQKNHDMVINEKQKAYLIEKGIDDNGVPYLTCENVTGEGLHYIDEVIEDETENNKYFLFKEWSFRLSSKPVKEYGLQ